MNSGRTRPKHGRRSTIGAQDSPGIRRSPCWAGTITPEVCKSLRLPARIAVLLPGSERYSNALRSLRDGFLAARYALMSACTAPDVVFYQVADVDDAPQVWDRAVAEGAEFIVGPLLPDSVERVAEVAGELPTLALNRLRDRAPPAKFRRIRAARNTRRDRPLARPWSEACTAALILYPAPTGDNGFTAVSWRNTRRAAANSSPAEQYRLTAVDYSDQISRLLKIGASSRRRQQLQRRLGTSLSFQPRRRQDADLVFVVARAPQGRLLVPHLRYSYSGDLPIFANQNIYVPDHPDNRDLNGVELPALPLLADAHVQVSQGGSRRTAFRSRT